ncbi:MAG: alpha/beta fold hydrolase [Acidimicrobiia bacterium]
MAITERHTTGSGVKIRYLDNAPADPVGLPIVFSPGLTDFADEYVEMLEFFAPRRVLAVEVRGRGGSEAPLDGYAVADHITDLEAVIEEEGFERFHMMTFSRGTSWALDLALAAPERVATFSIGDYLAFELGLPEGWATTQMEERFRGKPMKDRVQHHVLEGLQRQSKHRQLWDRLPELNCPMLVARGSEGGLVSEENAARFKAARPDIEIVVIPGAEHDLFRPVRLAYPRAVAEFIVRRTPGL